MEKIPVIVNPHSRKNKKMKGISVEIFKKIGGDNVDVRETQSLEDLDLLAKECKSKKIPYIAISGGDGTIHHVLSRFINVYSPAPLPPFLILKDGTMNNICRTLHLKGNGYDILKRLLSSLKENKPVATTYRNTMKIGDKFCFIFGTGISTNILDAVYEGDNKNALKVIRVILKAVFDIIFRAKTSSIYRRFKANVLVDGNALDNTEFLGILAGTVEYVAFAVKPLTLSNTGKSFNVIVSALSPIKFLRYLIPLLQGKSIGHPLHFNSHIKTMELISDNAFKYTMDGDLYTAEKELKIEISQPVELVII
jgi:diacylglycerol kinase family enzyme